GNIVAYMLTGRVDALRTWATRVFRNGTEEQQRSSLHALEQDAAALARDGITAAEVKARWGIQLASFLAVHPEAVEEVNALAVAVAAPIAIKTIHIGSQSNYGTGPFIAGDNYGPLAREF